MSRDRVRVRRDRRSGRSHVTAIAALARRDLQVTRSYRLSFVSDIGWGVLNLLVYFFISKLVDTGSGDIGVGSVLLLVRR